MRLLELFCGTKSVANTFKERGHEVFTIDNNIEFKPDLCIDILNFEVNMLPKEWQNPDVIWASPPCTTFSVATISRHFKNGKPYTSACFIGLALALKSLEIIKELHPKYWFVENPRGMLRVQHFMPNGLRKTITYCQYGMKYQKPTDIWTNAQHWIPKKACKSGDTCHDFQPRSYKRKLGYNVLSLGIQGLANGKERGKIPKLLCNEIVDICENNNLTIVQKELII